jgi:hypothetical protein
LIARPRAASRRLWRIIVVTAGIHLLRIVVAFILIFWRFKATQEGFQLVKRDTALRG